MQTRLLEIVNKLKNASKIILSTHRECDGDGLGAQLALYHALKKVGKNVRILNVDSTPRKYDFLDTGLYVQNFEGKHDPLEKSDIALIFDTNDSRLLLPLYPELQKNCKSVLFIDHHPVLNQGPAPTVGSHIDVQAASTGEIAYDIITNLNIPMDSQIAQAIYTSIVFDTQLFRFIRASSRSYLIAADLLKYKLSPETVHQNLFANHTVDKMIFLSKALADISYFCNGRLAVMHINKEDLLKHSLEMDDSRDVVDLIMNISTLEAAVLIREDGPSKYKISIRSKGNIPVLEVAESLGGGGHVYSSGAYLQDNVESIKKKLTEKLTRLIEQL